MICGADDSAEHEFIFPLVFFPGLPSVLTADVAGGAAGDAGAFDATAGTAAGGTAVC